jgi:DNA-binding MarR family transcriptional regulator
VLPVGKVGERLQVHPASVTNAMQRLEDAGLVERTANPDDGRSVLATITPAGRSLVERCTNVLNDEVFSALPLASSDVDAGTDLLREIRRAFGDLG